MMAREEHTADSAEVVADAEVAAGASATPAAPEAERIEPGSAAAPRWIRPISDYERCETTIVEGLRYG